MTRTPDDETEVALDSLLIAARAAPPVPSDALMARIVTDGTEAQARLGAPTRRQAALTGRSGWSRVGSRIGSWATSWARLWPGSAALAGCLAVGIGIGVRFEPDLTLLSALYLGDVAHEETVLWSYDLALEGGV